MTNEQRGNLYLLTGLVLGLAFGLFVAWVISPLKYTDTDPGALAAPYQAEYRRMIALAYQRGKNLERAHERLNLLGDEDPVQVLAAEAQRMLAEDQTSQEARALAILAADLNRPPDANRTPAAAAQATETEPTREATEESTATAASPTPPQAEAIRSPTPLPPTRTPTPFISPTPTRTRIPTFAPRATATPAPVQAAPFVLEGRRQICDGSVPPGLLQIEVADTAGLPMPGVRVSITWQDGQETFFTGLAPEISLGYADFLMAEGITYDLKVGEVSETVSGLTSTNNCGWKLTFTQAAGE